MNPPSALSGAMSRDRKPFTYTPGGLDLSEIKSERMAKRLMRNAMNQGVPEKPVQVLSPSSTTAPVALPNYNCMPVQVFPTFNLPANPKALLRTRSNPDPKDTPVQKVAPPSFVNNARIENNDTFNKTTSAYPQINNNRPASIYEYNKPQTNAYSSIPEFNYGSEGDKALGLPEISYDVEYLQAPSRIYSEKPSELLPKLEIKEDKDKIPSNYEQLTQQKIFDDNYKLLIQDLHKTNVNKDTLAGALEDKNNFTLYEQPKQDIFKNVDKLPTYEQQFKHSLAEDSTKVPVNESVKSDLFVYKDEGSMCDNIDKKIIDEKVDVIKNDINIENEILDEKDKNKTSENLKPLLDLVIIPIQEGPIPTVFSTPVITKDVEEDYMGTDEQKEVKVVKKQVTKENKENKVEEHNGNQNGDSVEAEMTVKIPSKKSAAKTETKVEVVKKSLPDGSTEEIKTTITKTTIDGRTEIKTKTETTIIPKEAESEEEVVEEEEEEEETVTAPEQKEEVVKESETKTVAKTNNELKENGHESNIVKTEERSETKTTKKVVIVQESPKQKEVEEEQEEVEEVEEEIESEEEAEPVKVAPKKETTTEPEPAKPEEVSKPVVQEEEEEEEEEEEVEEETEVTSENKQEVKKDEQVPEVEDNEEKATTKDEDEEEEEVEEEEEYEEAEATDEKTEVIVEKTEVKAESSVITEEVKGHQTEETSEKPQDEPTEEEEQEEAQEPSKSQTESQPEPQEEKPEPAPQTEYKIPIREPSVPLEKVEDVEIKPIGSTPIITRSHTENTEIITSTIDPTGGLTRQTEYNKVENIVTVNRTTKILDHNYENLTQQGIPTVKTYFPPPTIDRISTSPLPARPYQSVYAPESSGPTTERRHSLLLERLSMERQMPSDIYQYGNQSQEQPQFGEPQSEVLTVSNVKPSTITNSQWYTNQQTQTRQQNTIYNNVTSTPAPVSQPWAQPKSPAPQPQQHYQPQQQYQAPQQQYQPPPQPQYQPPQQTQYQPTPQPQYQPSYTEPAPERAPSSYSAYTPTPTWASNAEKTPSISQPSQYSYLNKDSVDSYQKTTQNYSSNYVPPPWEQDSSYVNYTQQDNSSVNYYQPPLQTNTYSPAPSQGWQPPQSAKFTKPAPIAYVPPAPNQSFVKPVIVEPPKVAGRKTYYSEYERRYITVPESTYIPTETKYQPQPDPSPQYYYDNNEPIEEAAEPQWRKELREFTEKTSQVTTETTSVQPPWEVDSKYAKAPPASHTPTPTWSQTLRPRSWRERSFESEYVGSQEWPKATQTLGRGRPLSTMGKSVDSGVPERTRGVSVDRYNPNNYQSPAEHPPVQAHTLTPTPHAGYHNPNVPGYHARASAEPRDLPSSYQHRVYRESRASPLQSRSFKYLQWITGTEN